MAVKDLAIFKLVGSVVKKTKDKIVSVSAKVTGKDEANSSNESVKDTFKAVVGKSKEPISIEGKSVDTKVKDSSKEESAQAQAIKKVYDSKTDKVKTVESTKKPTKKVDKTKAKKVATKTVKDSAKTAKVTATKKPKVESSKTTTTKSKKSSLETKSVKVEKVTKTKEAKVTKKENSKIDDKKTSTTKVEKPKAKKSPVKKVEEKVPTTEAKKQTVKKSPTKAVAGTKKEEKIKLYTADIKKHVGSVDDTFLALIVKNLGPSIYRRDAELVSCSDPKELETVKRNFLIKKLGFDKSENDMLDGEIQKVCETLKGVRTKYRATFYYLLAKNLKKESALS